MIQDQEKLEEFLNIVDTWKFGYTNVICKYFVLKEGDNRNLMYGVVGFANDEISPRSLYVETKHIIAGEEVFKFSKSYLNRIIKNLKTSPHIFASKDHVFSLKKQKSDTAQLYFNPLSYPNLNATFRSPYLTINVSSNYLSLPDPRAIDLELRLLDTPYENFQDLAYALKLPPDLLSSSQSPHIDVIATTPLISTDIKLQNRKDLDLKFYFKTLPEKEKFNVGIRIFKKDQSDPRMTINGTEFLWSKEGRQWSAFLKKEFEGAELVKVFPSYDGSNMANITIIDPDIVLNNRHEVHSAFHSDQALERFLYSTDADEFEYGVSALLHYLRLSSHHYSITKLTDGPDIVAFSGAGHIYVIECTTATPDHKGKLHRLHTRTEKLRAHYQKKGYNPDLVRPVLFTNLSKDNTSADRAAAENYKISLITKEDLIELVGRITNPPADQDLYEAALNAIPVLQSDDQLRLNNL